jgi:hypothetical protein
VPGFKDSGMDNSHCFIEQMASCLMRRYNLSCLSNDSFNSYFIKDKKTEEIISRELVLTLDMFSKEIHVSRFYPELKSKPMCKYLSAACFYLLIQHFASEKHLDETYHISLDCTPEVFSSFYTRLPDFHFTDTFRSPGRSICAVSDFEISDFECIGMISEEVSDDFELYYS